MDHKIIGPHMLRFYFRFTDALLGLADARKTGSIQDCSTHGRGLDLASAEWWWFELVGGTEMDHKIIRPHVRRFYYRFTDALLGFTDARKTGSIQDCSTYCRGSDLASAARIV